MCSGWLWLNDKMPHMHTAYECLSLCGSAVHILSSVPPAAGPLNTDSFAEKRPLLGVCKSTGSSGCIKGLFTVLIEQTEPSVETQAKPLRLNKQLAPEGPDQRPA
ncbi:breast carcinoma-amplified sequence 3 isoform X1 [Tachysurus ichikawai]